MGRHRWLRLGAIVLAVAVVLAGVYVVGRPAFIGNPDAVHIVVTEINHATRHNTVVFDHQFSQQATPVYAGLVAGGPLPDTPTSCPINFENGTFYRYELTFFHWGIVTARATDNAHGCMYFSVQSLLGTEEGYSWYRGDHPSLWVRLYELTNAPQPR